MLIRKNLKLVFNLVIDDFFPIFQVYKIENTGVDVKPIFIAENSLYFLIKNETVLLSLAKAFDPNAYEEKFNAMLGDAIEDYPIFLANIGKTATPFQADVMINFEDLFNILIDIKKKLTEEAAANAQEEAPPQQTDGRTPKSSSKKNK